MLDFMTFDQALEKEKAEKNAVYRERNLCVALIADLARGHGYPVCIARHDGEDWEDEWRNVLIVYLPGAGQISWHLHESELEHFKHIHRTDLNVYDGHTTEEKYNRIKKFVSVY